MSKLWLHRTAMSGRLEGWRFTGREAGGLADILNFDVKFDRGVVPSKIWVNRKLTRVAGFRFGTDEGERSSAE
jgi:hypothetical protein